MIALPKTKICPICQTVFKPWMTTQRICCNYKCALIWNRMQDEKQRSRQQRRHQRSRLCSKQKSWSEFNKEAQIAFNRYIRIRDQGWPCHACGCELNDNNPDQAGAPVDASHYRSRGAASQLRFNVFNCVVCCWHCNRDLSGNIPNLRKGLINRFGIDVVHELEASHVIERLSISYLIRLKNIFTRRGDLLLRLRAKQEEV